MHLSRSLSAIGVWAGTLLLGSSLYGTEPFSQAWEDKPLQLLAQSDPDATNASEDEVLLGGDESDTEDDELLGDESEDPEGSGDEDEDLLGGDDDPEDEDSAGLDEDLDSDEEEDEELETSFFMQQQYRAFGGSSSEERGGLVQSSSDDSSHKDYLVNAYQFSATLETSPYDFFYFRLLARVILQNDRIKKKRNEDYEFLMREAYFSSQEGNRRYRIGALQFKHGKVDVDSPIDILNMGNPKSLEYLSLEEGKLPVIGVRYDWLGASNFSLFAAPFRQKTDGTEYTIQRRELDESGTDNNTTESVFRPHLGATYGFGVGDGKMTIGAFRWFDKDNNIEWTSSALLSSSYKEKDTTINFATLDMDVPLGNYVLKADAGWFSKKNFYSYYKRTSDNASIFSTVQVPHTAVALSLERKFDNFFLMPVFSHRSLAKVPSATHIIGFENKETAASEERDLQKSQFGLVFILDTSETWNTTVSLLQSAPFKQTTATNIWTFKPGGEDHEFQLKLFHTASEKLLMTGKQIKSAKAFLQYQYNL
jgi:hypothetical protein